MSIIAIAAIGQNRAIGRDNTLLWDLPGDLRFFREATKGHPVIMGRATFLTIGHPLPHRTNIVLSHVPLEVDGITSVTSPEAALTAAKAAPGAERVFIIGGGQVYQLFLPQTEELWLTLVDDAPEADTFFPPFEEQFVCVKKSEPITENGITYRFSTWRKKR